MQKWRLALLGLAVTAALGLHAVFTRPDVEFSVQAIGPDAVDSYVLDLNARGDVLAMLPHGGGSRVSFVQHPGGEIEFLPANVPPLMAYAINDHGAVVGGIGRWAGKPAAGFLWRNGALLWIRRSGHEVEPRDVNNAGQVVGDTDHASFVWQNDRLTLLPDTKGVPAGAMAFAVNASGTIVGGLRRPGFTWQAGVWSNGRLRLLPHPTTLSDTTAVALTDTGDIIAGGEISHGVRAFLWRGGAWTDLGTLFGNAAPCGINTRGEIVGTSWLRPRLTVNKIHWLYFWRAFTFVDRPRAFVWHGGRMRDLNKLIPRRSGWVLTDAIAINDKGQIAGIGTYRGRKRSFLLTPVARR